MKCAVIQDLLPLYCDRACSQESVQEIEEHLKACPQCRAWLEQMQSSMGLSESPNTPDAAHAARRFQKRLRKKRRRAVAAAILAAVLVCLGGTAAADVERPISYTDGMVTAEMAYDQVIDVYYLGDSYASLRGFSRSWKGQTALFLGYTQTIKAQLVPIGEPAHAAVGNGILLDTVKGTANSVDRDIQAVYYLAGNYDALPQMDDEVFAQAAENAVLLWEKES